MPRSDNEVPLSVSLALLADELSAIVEEGLQYDAADAYVVARYGRVQSVAVALRSLAAGTEEPLAPLPAVDDHPHTSPLVSAEALVLAEDGQLLLIQRADDDLWALPGGQVNVGETVAEGVVREVSEETGLDVRPTCLLGVYDGRLWDSRLAYHHVHFVFECRGMPGSEITTPTIEAQDARWFDRNHLPPLSHGHALRLPDIIERSARQSVWFDPVDGPSSR